MIMKTRRAGTLWKIAIIPGWRTSRVRSGPPASSKMTVAPDWARRLASTHPALPAPATI
jgi:hypothetical protein